MAGPQWRMCLDVPDVERAIRFYTRVFGLTVGRRFDATFVELLGGPMPIDLLGNEEKSLAIPGQSIERTYARHWTPLHWDWVVPDAEETLRKALAEGGTQESALQTQPYGRIVQVADPFGHGLCILEMVGRGYDVLLDGKSG
jgi:predicted enzyme related to lactoylglutathione lyase